MQLMVKDLAKQCIAHYAFILEDVVLSHDYHGYVNFKPSTC